MIKKNILSTLDEQIAVLQAQLGDDRYGTHENIGPLKFKML